MCFFVAPACCRLRHCSLQLLELFGGTRDDWIADDLEGWLASNDIYEGMGAALQHLQAQHELYIVTTKQVRHVCNLTASAPMPPCKQGWRSAGTVHRGDPA